MQLKFLKTRKDPAKVELQRKLFIHGIKLDIENGHLSYMPEFKPINTSFQLVFVRHGQTYGNCGQSTCHGTIDQDLMELGLKDDEKRIFQGNVDSEINQLTEFGKAQALEVAIQLEKELLANNWQPDIVFYSPLTRAHETGLPFINRNKLEHCSHPLEGIREMSFGSSDNRRVCDIDRKDPWHLFYRQQHALVKKSGVNGNGVFQSAENFCEVLLRAREVLLSLEKNYAGKKIVMFSHSMFGAACNILYGHGRKYDNENYLAFDGKSKNGEHYVMPNAKPILLNFTLPIMPLLKARL